MDLTSLYFFKELAKDLHMTKTAERLFISQQTLSNHIQRLENSYGVALFYRKPKLALTASGECMLLFVEKVLQEEIRLKNSLSEMDAQTAGILRIGASPLRANICLPAILPQFSQKYPNVEIRLTDTTNSRLEQLVLDGELDMAICIPKLEHPSLIHTSVLQDQVYLCVADRLLHQYYGDETQNIKQRAINGAKIVDFARLPFFALSAPSLLSGVLHQCFDEAGCSPNIYLSASSTRMSIPLCSQGMAACLLTQMNISCLEGELAEDVNIFPLCMQEQSVYHTISLVCSKQRCLTKFSRYFIELITQYFYELGNIEPTKTVQTK